MKTPWHSPASPSSSPLKLNHATLNRSAIRKPSLSSTHKSSIKRYILNNNHSIQPLTSPLSIPIPNSNSTPESLQSAIMMANLPLCTAILTTNKSSLDRKDNKGNYPLHLAIISNNAHILSELLRHGADTSVTDALGRTPLDLLQGRLDIVKASIHDPHIADAFSSLLSSQSVSDHPVSAHPASTHPAEDTPTSLNEQLIDEETTLNKTVQELQQLISLLMIYQSTNNPTNTLISSYTLDIDTLTKRLQDMSTMQDVEHVVEDMELLLSQLKIQ